MEKKPLTWFMYLVFDSKLIYYDFISILNNTPKCIAIAGKMRKANKKKWLTGGVFFNRYSLSKGFKLNCGTFIHSFSSKLLLRGVN